MPIGAHHNHEYLVGPTFPKNVGDRYYAQDLGRDWHYIMDRAGLVGQDFVGGEAKVITQGGIVSQVVGNDEIDVTAFVGYTKFQRVVPDNFASLPPTTKNEDVEYIRMNMAAQVALDITTLTIPATLNGTAVNFVKVAYKELDGPNRTRAKKAGTYAYEQSPSFTITVDTVAATDKEIVLATIVSSGSGNPMQIKFDLRSSERFRGHYATNFSIDQRTDTEEDQMDNIQRFHRVPYGTKLESVEQDRTFMHHIDNFNVPAYFDEIIESGGGWSDQTSAEHHFGKARQTTTATDSIALDFRGVACYAALHFSTSGTTVLAELSDDGGSTYKWSTRFHTNTSDTPSADLRSITVDLFSGLKYGDYRVRLTNERSDNLTLSHFGYVTYAVQKPTMNNFYEQTSVGRTIAELPPTTTLFTGTFSAINTTDSASWNSSAFISTSGSAKAEFKFLGDAIWANLIMDTTVSTMTVLIDGVTTRVNTQFPSQTITHTAFTVDTNIWIRLDDGKLDDGIHTVELTRVSGQFEINGWSYHTLRTDSTVCRSFICGKDSEAIPVEDSRFTGIVGMDAATDNPVSFMQRVRRGILATSKMEIPTPSANVKAIYLIWWQKSGVTSGKFKFQLDGALDRFIDNEGTTANGSQISLAYDSHFDGSLDSKIMGDVKEESEPEGLRNPDGQSEP